MVRIPKILKSRSPKSDTPESDSPMPNNYALIDDLNMVIDLTPQKHEIVPYFRWVQATSKTKIGDTLLHGEFVTDPRSPEEKQIQLNRDVKHAVSDRITNHVNETSQINMIAAAAAGLLDEGEMNSFIAHVEWTQSIRQKGKELIESDVTDYQEDEDIWPDLSKAAQDFTKRY